MSNLPALRSRAARDAPHPAPPAHENTPIAALIDELTKRKLRLQVATAIAERALSDDSGEATSALGLAGRLRSRIYEIESILPFEGHTVVIPARAGFGRVRLHLVVQLIRLLDGVVSEFAISQTRFRHGDSSLSWSARADRAPWIAAILPEYLRDIDAAAQEAARIHRDYLKTLPDNHHMPSERENLVRAYRRTYMRVYGGSLAIRIALGIDTDRASMAAVPGENAAIDAANAVADADITRYAISGPRRVFALPAVV
ncbi:UNVERIFIED_ORG: hypothetical protein FHR35_009087 [Microbispora rosea subsp. rosea]